MISHRAVQVIGAIVIFIVFCIGCVFAGIIAGIICAIAGQ